jgi:hypothetical protein
VVTEEGRREVMYVGYMHALGDKRKKTVEGIWEQNEGLMVVYMDLHGAVENPLREGSYDLSGSRIRGYPLIA